MRTIWKYPFEVKGTVTIAMPEGARILPTIASSPDGKLIVWAEVDPEAKTEDRTLYVVGTGHPLPNGMTKYVGTVVVPEGILVWHVYEKDMLAIALYEQNLQAFKEEAERGLNG